ncbi:MSTO1 [Bugula neritina]|uniref:MSTO1 n=1 Tax=Bugula neritina TaxID=10212 RepID=A0A7J7JM58_BUGNE|nr:MSTO1 [Bugula neritina]
MHKETVTFQIGHLSNFVGAHWWNLQEASFVYEGSGSSGEKAEINHDVTFREGEVTYTPRLISVDLSEALHCLKQEGVLYDFETDGDCISWVASRNAMSLFLKVTRSTLHKEAEKYKKNEFLRDLEREDNPEQDVAEVDESSSKEKMEAELLDSTETESKADEPESSVKEDIREKMYSLDDSVHSWCDYLRVHLHPKSLSVVKGYYQTDNVLNLHNLGSDLYNRQSSKLREELEDKIHFFTEEADNLQGFHMLADIYDGFGGLASSVASDISDEYSKRGCISFCPFYSQRTSQDNSQSLHDLINSVLSVVRLIEAGFTVVPLSLVDNPWNSVHHKHTQLPGLVYKVSNLSLTLPLPLESHLSSQSLFNKALNPLRSLSPLHDGNVLRSPSVQSVVLRGAEASYESLLQEAVSTWYPSTSSSIMEVRKPCKVTSPFPHIFDSNIDEFGYRSDKPREKRKGVQSVAAMTSLSTTNQSVHMLTHLLERSRKLNRRHLHKHLEAGMEQDDWSDSLNTLEELIGKYEDGDAMETSDSE